MTTSRRRLGFTLPVVARPLSHVHRNRLGHVPAAAIAVSGKELQLDDTAGAARLLLARHAVKTIPVLDGRRYVGAVDRELLATVGDDVPMHELATSSLLPTSAAATPAWDALAALDAHGGTRLVVLAADGETYVGIVCLRGDRDRLCVDARLALDAGR